MREVKAIPGKDIFLGRCGENKATCVVFDISDWQRVFGDGTAQMIHQRNGDKQPYPCVLEQDGDTVVWCITNSDVAVAGRGRVELQFYMDDTLVKSETFTTVTERALSPASETPPDPFESWMDTMLGVASDAQESAAVAVESAATAVSSANAAAKSESNAKESEVAAANSASTATISAINAKSDAEIAYSYSAAARDYMAEADGSRKAAVEAAIEAQAHANSIVGDKEAAAASAASAKASAAEATASKSAAATSAANAEIAALNAARDAAAGVEKELADYVAAAERAEELARNSANESVLNQKAAANNAVSAANHANRAIEAANDAQDSAERAEAAARNAEQQAGGEFATPAYVDSKAAAAESNANKYTDEKLAGLDIPTPDVSGQINAHNADENAHADIRNMIQNIPVPDVSAQINAHNANGEAHADIRQIAHNAASLATSANATAEAASRNADWAYDEATSKASIFYCFADSTELWEIDEQIDNGNLVILDDIGRYVPLVSADYGVSYIFRGAVDDSTVITAFVDSDGWTVTESEAGGIPEDHASTDTTYGKGSGAYYGHVKLSDSISSTDSSSSGVAASPVAVKTAYDKAVSAQTAATNAANAASAAQTAANTAQSTATAAQTAANNAQAAADSKAPMYTYGTTDLTAGSSSLESGKLYFVYE